MKTKTNRKSIISIMLCVAMLLTVIMPSGLGDVYAADISEEIYYEEASFTDASEDKPSESALDINFAVIEEPSFATPAKDKYIVIDMGDEDTAFEDARLVLLNETTGKEYEINADTIKGSSMLFYADFPDETYTGKYLVEKVIYKASGNEFEKYTADSDMVPKFGVNCDAKAKPDLWLVDENATQSITDMADTNKEIMDISDQFDNADAIGIQGPNSDITIVDESASINEEVDRIVSQVKNKVESESVNPKGSMASTSGNIIVVLDPGHGGSDPGAVRNWNGVVYSERDINQKIANACKAELEKNPEVTVYLTRTDTSTALHGSTAQDLAWRCKFAYDVGADLFVSLHCNSGGPTVKGVEVYVPNKSLHENNYNVGQAVGGAILAKLVELGIANRGLIAKNSANGSTYSDGSIADYYAVIKGCKQYGIPGMIVEHDYISNQEDCVAFFGDDTKIYQLGAADAAGILSCLETLKQNRTGGAIGDVNGSWDTVDGKKVYRDANGNLVTGFFAAEGNNYYADANGYIVTGLKTIEGKKYYFDTEGIMLVSGWMKIGKVKYYFTETGAMAKSQWVIINGKTYYFKKNGKRYGKGWKTVGGKSYYFKKGGSIYTNKWIYYGIYKRYLGSDGRVVKGWQLIKNKKYYFDKNGNLQYGWLKKGGKKYYLNPKNGKAFTGWHKIWGVKYYFDTEGVLCTQFTKIGKKTYYLLSSGGFLTGWQTIKGKKYFFSKKGVMKTGWTTYGGHRAYLMDETGELAKKTFVTDKNGDTYYFDKKYKFVTGYRKIRGERYVFGDDGKMMKAQWVDVNGIQYYARDNGMFSHSRFETIGEFKYYFDANGYKVTGVQVIPYNGVNYTYTFDAEGKLVSGDGPATNYEDDVAAAAAAAAADNGTDATGMYTIMGASTVTVADMVARYTAAGKTYPSTALTAGGAATITDFCSIIKEEAEAEGVRAEVLYAQVMCETGWLQFGGDVKISQYNFGGLGATGGGVAGESFADVRTGLRAQTQHLKGYATADPLVNVCVDSRYKYVSKGCAPYVEYLGIKENPTGKGWATAERYGYRLLEVITSMKAK